MEEKFKNFCNKLIEENESELKYAREKVRVTSKKNTKPAIVITMSGVVVLLGFAVAEQINNIIGIAISLLALLVGYVNVKKVIKEKMNEKDEYNEIYQQKIIKPLMQLFYKEPYCYTSVAGIPREVFEEIELRKFNMYSSTNLIVGTMKQKYNFKMANVVAKNRNYKNHLHNHEGEYYDTTIFNGILIEIELNKIFNHYLYMKQKENILYKDISEIESTLKIKKYELQNQDLRSKFEIYTSNQDFAKDILSTEIVEKLEKYENIESNKSCELVIKKNYVYLMLPNAYIPGTNVILYEDRENMVQKLWKQYEKFYFAFEASEQIINKLMEI